MSAEFADRAEALRERTMAVLRVAFLSSTVLELFSAIGVAMVAVYVGFALLGEIPFGAWATPLTLSEGIFLLMLAPEFFQPLRDLAAAWHDKAGALAVTRELAEAEAQQKAEISERAGCRHFGHRPDPCAQRPAPRRADLPRPDNTPRRGTGPHRPFGQREVDASVAHRRAGEARRRVDHARRRAPVRRQCRRLARPDRMGAASRADAGRPLRRTLTLGCTDAPGEAEIAAALDLASATGSSHACPAVWTPNWANRRRRLGGEARRLMLARAALSGRPVLLADEPTADLDPTTAAEVIAALMALKARGATVIVATHDAALAEAMDRRVALAPQALEGAA
jgi:ATP-binding cassette subfamily C protein CydD